MKKLFSILFTVIFFVTPSIGLSLEKKDLIFRDGLYYKKFTDVPFTRTIAGKSIIMDSYLIKVISRMEIEKVLGLNIIIKDN